MTCSYLDRTVGPFAIQTFLNEWLRFRKPGHYRFFVRSFRAFGRGEVVSNVVSLRILAADESRWERLMWQWENGARDEAARGIRYIGTPEATEFMGRHLREHTSFTVGLANSPPLETLRALAGVDDTNGLRGFQILRLVAPVALPYGPWQDREEGWRREAAQRLSSVYQAGLQALNGWLEPGN